MKSLVNVIHKQKKRKQILTRIYLNIKNDPHPQKLN